jgi:hypothetical protein
MEARRLRAPDADAALLSEPPRPEAGALLGRNARSLEAWDYDFQGRPAARLRAAARQQVVAKARDYLARAGLDAPELPRPLERLIVTGHQPDLFHPGVWVKNFAAAGLARDHGGVGLNLIVDNDIPKSASIRVPHPDGDEVLVQRVEYDDRTGEVPFEELAVRDEGLFSTFPDRVRRALAGAVSDPLIDDYWPRALRRRGGPDRLGYRLAAARREVEAAWGAQNLEVPLSALCETDGFYWFAAHLLAQLPRFQAVHNEALARYRTVYKIRSKHHPVPALGRRGVWAEAPFWVWRATEPRRHPLLVRQLARTMQLRIGGEDAPLAELPLGPDREACCAVEQLRALPAAGVRLRTRALTTTMFARLLLGDLFLHGIGGAKYDELGDEIIRRFFGLEPPAYLTLSMTLWLGLRSDPSAPQRLADVERDLRDLTYNPDRHLPAPADPQVVPLVAAKRQAIAGPVETHAERLARCRAVRRCNEGLQPWVEEPRRRLQAERSLLRAGVVRNALARNREYAFVLHSERRLREVMSLAQAGGRSNDAGS